MSDRDPTSDFKPTPDLMPLVAVRELRCSELDDDEQQSERRIKRLTDGQPLMLIPRTRVAIASNPGGH
jgi:hypothetical protein